MVPENSEFTSAMISAPHLVPKGGQGELLEESHCVPSIDNGNKVSPLLLLLPPPLRFA
jgi:hypothetical protein